jgi:hypothetical protein
MNWVLVKNIKCDRGLERLATVVDENGVRLVFSTKKEAEEAAADMNRVDEVTLEMYEDLKKQVRIRSMGPVLIIPEKETIHKGDWPTDY